MNRFQTFKFPTSSGQFSFPSDVSINRYTSQEVLTVPRFNCSQDLCFIIVPLFLFKCFSISPQLGFVSLTEQIIINAEKNSSQVISIQLAKGKENFLSIPYDSKAPGKGLDRLYLAWLYSIDDHNCLEPCPIPTHNQK